MEHKKIIEENIVKLKKSYNYSKGIKHNLSASKICAVLYAMKQRCNNKKHCAYKHYGARGIKVCEEWSEKEKGIVKFNKWAIENGYKEGLTIERINVDGNYEPNNCKLVTQKEQARNTRRNIFLTFENKTMCIMDWANYLNIGYRTISDRHKRGLPIEKVLFAGILINRKNSIKKVYFKNLEIKVEGVENER